MAEEQQDIYDSAIADAPVEETPVEAPVEAPAEAAPEQTPVETPAERLRDEYGRFAAKVETPEPKPEARPEPVEHRIPLAELLNEREKRQSEQRRAEMLMRELEQLKQQLQAPKSPPPDQFQHPEEYNAYWQSEIDALRHEQAMALRNASAEFSMRIAHREHKGVFEEAYQAVMNRAAEGDRSVAQMVANAPDPGEAMVNWYKRESTLQTVGNDPQAFAAKLLEEALDNPEFLAKALEKAKGIAAKSPTQVSLPPSLNKATSSGRPIDTSVMSDAQLYQHSIGR